MLLFVLIMFILNRKHHIHNHLACKPTKNIRNVTFLPKYDTNDTWTTDKLFFFKCPEVNKFCKLKETLHPSSSSSSEEEHGESIPPPTFPRNASRPDRYANRR